MFFNLKIDKGKKSIKKKKWEKFSRPIINQHGTMAAQLETKVRVYKKKKKTNSNYFLKRTKCWESPKPFIASLKEIGNLNL